MPGREAFRTKVGVAPSNPLELILAVLVKGPAPFLDTWLPLLQTRAILAATTLGVFDTLAPGPQTAVEVARQCGTDAKATRILLDALVSLGYLRLLRTQYSLASVARKWLLKDSPSSLHDIVLHRFLDWDYLTHLEDFIRTGEPMDIHATMTPERWGVYQKGMRAIAGIAADEMARKTPVPPGARNMLDIGGSHGYYSVAICQRHPGLRATVLDLPEAIEHAAPLLAKEGMGERVVHHAGNALTDDLGSETFDLVLLAQVAHHFTEAQNRALAGKIARALRPGGYYVIQEAIRPARPKSGGSGPFIALFDLYFGLTSESGSWSFEEMASWQRDAGLSPRKPIRSLLPVLGWQVGVKPSPSRTGGLTPRRGALRGP